MNEQHPGTLAAYAHSPVEEVVAVAQAIERSAARLTNILVQVQRDRADVAAVIEFMADGVLVLDVDDRLTVDARGALPGVAASTMIERFPHC